MNIIKISLEKKDGTIYYTTNEEDLIKIISSMPKVQFRKTGSLQSLHKKYFVMVEELRVNTDARNNYSKVEFPNAIKPLIFKYLQDFKQAFTTGVPEYSTKNLNVEGYSLLIEQLINVGYDLYSYTFKNRK